MAQGQQRVLVTGSAGRIGRAVVAELTSCGHAVRGLDRVPTPGASDFIVADITDFDAVKRAAAEANAVIHLAATPDDADFLTQLLPPNIIGLHHVLEGARLGGARRVVVASSGQVNWWQRQRQTAPIGPREPVTPRYWYAATKVFAEAIGQGYSETHGLEVIAVRLGWVPRDAPHIAEISGTDWAQDVYLSPGDAGRFFAAAVAAPMKERFAILYATSKPVDLPRFDLAPTKELLGWEPRDQWPEGSGQG
jgi:nucleoside-diphosphate-sugar epimerase